MFYLVITYYMFFNHQILSFVKSKIAPFISQIFSSVSKKTNQGGSKSARSSYEQDVIEVPQ